MAHKIAEKVNEAGGRVFFVGGYVRDRIMNLANKDIDIEVHGIEAGTLAEILDSLGELLTMGASFEIMKLRHYDLDIALPVDIDGGAYKAALRRDFTMNALMQDVLTGEILDFFGGIGDIESRTIKHVSSKTFTADPLRVLRAARFAACLNFDIDSETKNFASLVNIESLPNERVINELSITLLKAVRPSKFFEALQEMSQADYYFPGIKNFELIDSVAEVRDSAQEKLYFMIASLCVDLDLPEKFLTRLTSEEKLIKYVLNMLDLLKRINFAVSERDYMKIFDDSICGSDLLLLSGIIYGDRRCERENFFALYNSRMREPYLMGRDLIINGVKPGALMGEALKFAHDLRLMGVNKDEQLTRTLKFLRECEAKNL